MKYGGGEDGGGDGRREIVMEGAGMDNFKIGLVKQGRVIPYNVKSIWLGVESLVLWKCATKSETML